MDIHQGMFLNGDKIFVPQRGATSLANMCSDAIRTFSAVRNVVFKDGMATGIQTDDGGSFVSWNFLAIGTLPIQWNRQGKGLLDSRFFHGVDPGRIPGARHPLRWDWLGKVPGVLQEAFTPLGNRSPDPAGHRRPVLRTSVPASSYHAVSPSPGRG